MGGLLASALLITCCKDPLDNFELKVSTEILHYTDMIQVEDGNGNPVSDVKARILGKDAAAVYNLAGYKNFAINGGLLGLGLHPDNEPVEGKPVKFEVELSGSGYLTQVIPVVITKKQPYSVITARMLRLDDAPAGVAVEQTSLDLQSGALPADATVSTIIENEASQTAGIKLSEGTGFLDENANAIQGENLNLSVVYLDASKETALGVFPGGGLNADNVLPAGGGQVTSGAFNPSAVVNIEFFIGTTPVKRFNKPISLSIGLDPAFYNLGTGAVIKEGDQLSVYSYEVSSAQWRFEKFVTVEMKDGKPVANFETDHLTWYMVGNYINSCTEPALLRFSGNWMLAGNSYPLKVEALLGGKVINSLQASVSADNPVVNMADLPLSSGALSIRVSTADGQLLTAASGMQLPAADCGQEQVVALNPPAYNSTKVTLQLYVRCPGNQTVVNVLPTFYLYYRTARTSDDPTGFKLLGVVKNGFLSTSLLTVGATAYDFKAIWGDNIKYAYKKTVKADNSATVGTAPGDIIGEKVGANNLGMLEENCP